MGKSIVRSDGRKNNLVTPHPVKLGFYIDSNRFVCTSYQEVPSDFHGTSGRNPCTLNFLYKSLNRVMAGHSSRYRISNTYLNKVARGSPY